MRERGEKETRSREERQETGRDAQKRSVDWRETQTERKKEGEIHARIRSVKGR